MINKRWKLIFSLAANYVIIKKKYWFYNIITQTSNLNLINRRLNNLSIDNLKISDKITNILN